MLIASGLVLGVLFGLFGGEYSTLDWLQLRSEVRAERETIADLHRITDSLERLADQLENDPAVQERAARERFGMVRPGERIYRIISGPPEDPVTRRDSVP